MCLSKNVVLLFELRIINKKKLSIKKGNLEYISAKWNVTWTNINLVD